MQSSVSLEIGLNSVYGGIGLPSFCLDGNTNEAAPLPHVATKLWVATRVP